ncbi:MAG: hypothetical protein KatS3mg036_1041 [Ignavibacterium sp.]|uniref:T9SS-dependent choice-of-anchor J family protein n=1 Tax=Ignavibacterium sp. TaxID=2651167 RepID=UPI0021DD0A17|nr:choice-of-anchor J domain-containing protein [Ignavibacterium sp.]BDQ02180.1 MAG: hypothetical protein KatS3mg037_0755 [Ignavibacterium sp.]GIV46223.1 MAG: hypothetical protein KatS3mg036_1041 [Ignavibacterium sp.]
MKILQKIFLILLIFIVSVNSQNRLNENFSDSELFYRWRIVNRDNGIQTWAQSNLKYKTPPYSIACRFESSTLQNDDWIISPKVQVAAGDSLTFYHSIISAAFPESLYVKIGTTNNPNSGTWTNLAVIYDNTTEWKYKKYSLNAYAGQQVYIAFVNRSKDAYFLFIDDVNGPAVVTPNNDIALVNFYQSSGLPSFSMYSNSELQTEEISLAKNLLTVDYSSFPAKESDVNNSTLINIPAEDLPIEYNNLYLSGIVRNFGRTSTSYQLNWVVNGFTQTPFLGNYVNPNARDSFSVKYQPTGRGTFTVTGNLVLSGDENLHNNSQKKKIKVYPNAYSITKYDRGDNFADTWMGYGNPNVRFKAAVRFEAEGNIKLAGVDFLYQTEYITSGQFEIQIRAAGSTINSPGAVLYTKTYSTSDYLTGAGDLIHFAFDDNAPSISAGSDYWITIKLPSGILFPAGVHSNGFINTHSYYQSSTDTTLWYPLIVAGSERAWIMRAVHIPVPTTFSFTQNINNGWNLVSVPGAHPNNQNINTWWQYRDLSTNVYELTNNRYQTTTEVTTGKGYWLKHSGNRIYNTGDEWPGSGLLSAPNLPINVTTGWNIIGVYQTPLFINSNITSPPNIISSYAYGYDIFSGFYSTNTLQPGRGYFIKFNTAGKIVFSPSMQKDVDEEFYLEKFSDKIIITDNLQRLKTLYLTDEKINFDFFELPPLPFSDIFDIRFSSNRLVETLSAKSVIQLQAVDFPVKIKLSDPSLFLTDENGNNLNNYLNSDGEIVIDNPSIKKIFISNQLIPDEFTLEQNYPNPFNPTTKIQYSISSREFVQLKVYDLLGNEVATLVNEEKPAGRYEVEFTVGNGNISNSSFLNKQITSGIYFYKLTAGEFSSVKKMILIK